MLFSSYLSILLVVLLIQIETAYTKFACQDKSSNKNKAATVAFCMRITLDSDTRSLKWPTGKKKSKWITNIAKPEEEAYTCRDWDIFYHPATRGVCCPPKKEKMTYEALWPANPKDIATHCYYPDVRNMLQRKAAQAGF
ncbi:hypothetical protein PTTG_28714 [Puccinia triticina 1-1 BBBD Race 1]|uniref:Secreted protein n=2 Tax=Puccinia triticina TaxID=208348 RepID=A0A180GBQ2_PUCT1|nr:uncharacterized protein PtA15_13A439 [Puccinia triticina]OAV89333.1 hypothetical protein PTTG_28714 [Puccinia triticina 1-1 BBBD Race 1]WAQ91039.1 hypothetical protein PtA15_13A439 [Puccinia triticina]WAR61232.1 hypothetical protein PtB15_13B484 [Puccinia triticina]